MLRNPTPSCQGTSGVPLTDIELVSRNTPHFSRIDGLRLADTEPT